LSFKKIGNKSIVVSTKCVLEDSNTKYLWKFKINKKFDKNIKDFVQTNILYNTIILTIN
jgi:hypothetical protein